MDHNEDCPCATDNVPHGAGCADCSCVKNICPTCEGDVKGEIVDGKCRACQLGVIPDWMKPKDIEKRVESYESPECGNCGGDLVQKTEPAWVCPKCEGPRR